MARFNFALDPLLRARQRDEQAAQRKVATIERERLVLEDRIRRKQRAISEGKLALKGVLVGVLHMDTLHGYAGNSLRQMRDAQRIVLELAGVHRRLETARGILLEAVKRRRAIELLREHRFERWKAEQDRAERNAQDELVVIAAARKDDAS